MNSAVRRGIVVTLLMLSAGCGSTGPVSPTETGRSAALPQPDPPPVRSFPSLSGPSRTFLFRSELSHHVRDHTKQSRFVLYDNGAFALEYPSLGTLRYRGVCIEANGVLSFEWESAGSWGATGTLKGDSLAIQYNVVMNLTDFEDAEYGLMQ